VCVFISCNDYVTQSAIKAKIKKIQKTKKNNKRPSGKLYQQWLTELTLFCGRKLHRHMER